MPKSLFEIQTESGQLWLDIKHYLDAAEADKASGIASAAASFADREPAASYLERIKDTIKLPDLTARQTLDGIKVILSEFATARRARRIAEAQAKAAAAAAELAAANAVE